MPRRARHAVLPVAQPVPTTAGSTGNLAATVAQWSARHRATAIVGWLLLVIGATLLSGTIGTRSAAGSELGSGRSARAEQIIDAAGFPEQPGEMVLIRSDQLTVDSPQFQAALRDVTVAVEATGEVANLASPLAADGTGLATDGAGLVSADRHAALVTFELAGDPETAPDRVGEVLDAVAGVQAQYPDLTVAQAGAASGDRLIGESLDRDLQRLSMLSIPLTLGILLVAFGALLAAVIPIGLAITGFLASLGLLAVASRAIPTVDATAHLMLLIGLAVGVDYCLFYIRREREERANGADRHQALAIAAATSGRSVLISGLTVVVAMAGMFLTGDGTFMSFAVGTILVVLVAVLGSLTVLPALLSKLGDRVDLGKIPGLYRRPRPDPDGTGTAQGRVWRAVLGAVLRRPGRAAALSAGALALVALPALQMHTASPGISDVPNDLPLIATFKQIEQAFPGGTDPAVVVVKAADVTTAETSTAIEQFRQAAIATGQLHEPITVEVNPDRTVAVIDVGLAGSGTDAVSEDALHTLRDEVVPATLGQLPGAEVGVTGLTAWSADFNDLLSRSVPLVFGFVLGLAFLLLLVSFRSLVVAVTAIALNLLSVAAAYGLLVLTFQFGWGESLLDFTSTGEIANWLPLFLFVILFGLSMDYHVFVLSRIREGHDRGLTTRQAVANGIAGTAGTITSAAVVMVAVFGLFASMSLVSMKQLGFGLAAAILIDATIVRAVLLPAVMALLGERNWYLPRWLRWLPELSHGQPGPAGRPAAGPVAVGAPAGEPDGHPNRRPVPVSALRD
ncbi:MAG: MMPL family transporter [Sporichthyaceae bacterium]|nr:MMPL family transporter [Sporichthyaceae bacterium]